MRSDILLKLRDKREEEERLRRRRSLSFCPGSGVSTICQNESLEAGKKESFTDFVPVNEEEITQHLKAIQI